MAIFLTVLKWLGIILLILLALVLIILLVVLLVPLKYEARAAVNDPDSHEQFPVSVLKEQSNAAVTVSWFLGALKVIAAYPSKELLCVKVFGKDIGIMDKLSKGKKEEPEEEKQEPKEEKEEDNRTLAEKAESRGCAPTQRADSRGDPDRSHGTFERTAGASRADQEDSRRQ